MLLDPKIEAMFVKARDIYAGPPTGFAYANRLVLFNKFYDLIKNNSQAITQINKSYQSGILEDIVYFPPSTVSSSNGPANPSERSGFGPEPYTLNGGHDISSLSLIKNKKKEIQVKGGTLYIGDDMIKFANRWNYGDRCNNP